MIFEGMRTSITKKTYNFVIVYGVLTCCPLPSKSAHLSTYGILSYGRRGWLNAFYWYQLFALDYVVFQAQHFLSSHGGFRFCAMYHYREALIKFTHYGETKTGLTPHIKSALKKTVNCATISQPKASTRYQPTDEC